MLCFLSCRPFVVSATFSTGLVGRRPAENVALTAKGLQEGKHNIEWDDGGKIGNKNK